MATCAPLARLPANSASLPKATHRCHSVRDSHVPASFFHDVLVASENTAMFVALLTFFSASPPRKPMRVILLRYIRFSCSARLSRAPGSEWARLPRPEAAFLGGPARGNQNRNGAEGKAEASQAPGAARAPKQCRDKGWNRKRTGNSFRHVGRRRQVPGQRRTRLNERSRRNSRGTVGAGQHPGARLRRLSPTVAMVKTAEAWQRSQSGVGIGLGSIGRPLGVSLFRES